MSIDEVDRFLDDLTWGAYSRSELTTLNGESVAGEIVGSEGVRGRIERDTGSDLAIAVYDVADDLYIRARPAGRPKIDSSQDIIRALIAQRAIRDMLAAASLQARWKRT